MVDLKVIDKYMGIPLKTGQFIIDNSLYLIEELIKNKSKFKSKLDDKKMRYEDIDIGVSGMILFLIELNKARQDSRIVISLNKAGFELIDHCSKNHRTHFGFYCGRGGVCYTLAELTEATGEKKFLNYALELIRNELDNYINSEFTSDNLYEGRSGLLIVLLHLYNKSKQEWILGKIKICLIKLTENFLITDQGIVWNKHDKNIHVLNSFFYGSAGVAFAIHQIAQVSKDPELFCLASALFQHSDKDWNENSSAWPDYKNAIKTVEDFINHKKNFLSKKYDFFTKYCQSYDLAHGTAGICLARLPLLGIKTDSHFNNITKQGISKLIDSELSDHSISSGLSGIGMLYAESYKNLKDPIYLERAMKVANVLNSVNCKFDNLELFYGTTGVAYFLLQVLYIREARSLFCPLIENRKLEGECIINNPDSRKLTYGIFRATFPYTFFVINSFSSDHSLNQIEGHHLSMAEDAWESMQSFINSLETQFPSKHFQLMKDVFSLERAKIKMFADTRSFSLNHIKNIVKFEDKVALLNMSDKEFNDQLLVFDNDISLINVKWNWARFNQRGADWLKVLTEFLNSEPKEIKLFLFRDINNTILQEKLDDFGLLTYNIFNKPLVVKDSAKMYLENFKSDSSSDDQKIVDYSKQYINYYIKKSILGRLGI